jgi:hypothetical protein
VAIIKLSLDNQQPTLPIYLQYPVLMKNYLVLVLIIFNSCTQGSKPADVQTSEGLYRGKFGTCCADLGDALNKSKIPNSFFVISSTNVLYQTVGYVDTAEGPGYFDQAVIFCPFCGKKLQDKVEIKRRAN